MQNDGVCSFIVVKQIAEELPTAPTSSYLLCDSWYVCEKVVNAFLCKGFHTVGALKTNRILHPYGVKMHVREFAEKLTEAQCKELFHSYFTTFFSYFLILDLFYYYLVFNNI